MFKLTKVQLAEIRIDTRRQRALDEERAERISKTFDWNLFVVPVLSLRADGKHYAVDGQHRVRGAVMAGHGDSKQWCVVHEGLNLIQEADMFLDLNKYRKATNAWDKWRVSIEAGRPNYVEADEIVSSFGLRASNLPGIKNVCAVEALISIHDGAGNLAPVLSIAKQWSQGDVTALERTPLRALSAFLKAFPDVSEARVVRALRGVSPAILRARLQATQQATKVSPQRAAVLVIMGLVNKSRGEKLTLTE